MCQALGQHSIRAITKLNFYFYFFFGYRTIHISLMDLNPLTKTKVKTYKLFTVNFTKTDSFL